MATGHGVDEYLETIYFLAFPIGEYKPLAAGSQTIASRVAEMLGVSRASAGEMLKRLEAEGLVERGEHKEAILTEAGAERARRVVRKHRIIERLLTDFMGYTAAEAHVHADELGGTFSDEMVERIEELIKEHFDLRPAAILRDLDLQRPIFSKTAAYGHFGRDDHDFTWERTDKADDLRAAAGLAEAAASRA